MNNLALGIRGQIKELEHSRDSLKRDCPNARYVVDISAFENRYGRYLVGRRSVSNSGFEANGRGLRVISVEPVINPILKILGIVRVIESDLQGHEQTTGIYSSRERGKKAAYERAKRVGEIIARGAGVDFQQNIRHL